MKRLQMAILNQRTKGKHVDIMPNMTRASDLLFQCRVLVGLFGIDLIWGLVLTLSVPYCVSVGMSLQTAQMVQLGAPVVAVVVQPAIGAASDVLGKRKPFILWGTIGTVVSGCVFGAAPFLTYSESGRIAMVIVGFIFVTASVNIMQVPYRSYAHDVLPEDQRARGQFVSGIMMAFGSLVSNFTVFMIPNPTAAVPYLMFASVTVCLVTGIISISATGKENGHELDDSKSLCYRVTLEPWVQVGKGTKLITKEIGIGFLVQLFQWLSMMLFIPYITTYFSTIIYDGDADNSNGIRIGALATLIQSCVQFLSPLVVYQLFHKESVKMPWLGSLLVLIGTTIGLGFVPSVKSESWGAPVSVALIVLTGIPKGLAFALPFAFITSTAPKDQIGLFTGMMSTLISIGNLIDQTYVAHLTDELTMRGNFFLAAIYAFIGFVICFLLPRASPKLQRVVSQPEYLKESPV